MTEKQIHETWVSLSQKVLSSVLADPGAAFPVLQIIGNNPHWFPIKDRPIWLAVNRCMDEMIPSTIEAVSSRSNGVSPEYVRHIASRFNNTDNQLLIYNAEQLRDYGILMHSRELAKKFLEESLTTDNIERAINAASTELSGALVERTNRNSGAFAIGESAWDLVENFNGNGVPTGLKWFDRLTGGLWFGMNYWIAAAYKSGKTTLMRNCMLAAARDGHPVAGYCAENSREMFTLACIAMLATEYQIDRKTPITNCRLSAIRILMNWKRNRRSFRPDETEAIEWARDEWSRLPIRLYDSSDGIRDMATFQYLIKKDKIEYGVKVVWGDYSQLFGGSRGTLFERQSHVALKVQDIATVEKIAFCMLAQKNEAGIQAGGDGYSANIKGGGDATAAADFLLIPTIDQETKTMKISLKHSRHTPSGAAEQHLIAPSSGLILDKWFEPDTKTIE